MPGRRALDELRPGLGRHGLDGRLNEAGFLECALFSVSDSQASIPGISSELIKFINTLFENGGEDLIALSCWTCQPWHPFQLEWMVGQRVLQPAALWLHGKEQRTRATAAELGPQIKGALASIRWKGGTAADFLRTVRDESGLLTGWGPDHFGFMHLGFHIYDQGFQSQNSGTELVDEEGELIA